LKKGPPDIGNHDLTAPLHLSNQNHLPPSCYFQGIVSHNQPTTIAAWYRWQRFTFTGSHHFTVAVPKMFSNSYRPNDRATSLGSDSDRLGTSVLQSRTRKTDLTSHHRCWWW
jgi:hypothetical protein